MSRMQRQATEAVERTVSDLGRLDILINNAGVMLLGPATEAPLSEWKQMVELNVLGLLYCAHAALPHLISAAADGPRQVADMVNISSVAGRVARNGSGVYSPHQAWRRGVERVLASRNGQAVRQDLIGGARRHRHGVGESQSA